MRSSCLPIDAALAWLATLSLGTDVMAATIACVVRRATSVAGYRSLQDLT